MTDREQLAARLVAIADIVRRAAAAAGVGRHLDSVELRELDEAQLELRGLADFIEKGQSDG